MPTFMTRHGRVSFTAQKTNPKRKKTRSKTTKAKRKRKAVKKAARKTNPGPKTYSKKVGRWRVECKGRTVYAAGAKHAYANKPAACAAYKRLNSVKSIENFVARYGKKATKAAVLKTSRKPVKKVAKRKGTTRKNAPVRSSDAAAMRRILRAHGF